MRRLLLALALLGCSPQAPVTQPFGEIPAAPTEDTLVVAKPDDASGLDPAPLPG